MSELAVSEVQWGWEAAEASPVSHIMVLFSREEKEEDVWGAHCFARAGFVASCEV